jgi:hypothetical protein
LRDSWSTATFVTNYLPVILFPVLYGVAKIVIRAPLVKASEMDFHSDIAEIEAMTWVFVLFVCLRSGHWRLRYLFFFVGMMMYPRRMLQRLFGRGW